MSWSRWRKISRATASLSLESPPSRVQRLQGRETTYLFLHLFYFATHKCIFVKVYRGHSWTNRHPHETTGFQTWGAGARFASVPTLSGNCWFAAITERNYAGPDYGSSGSSSRGSSNDMIGYLLDRFKGWHSPIRELIHLTEDGADGIQFDYAHAFDAVYKSLVILRANIMLPLMAYFVMLGSYGMLSRIDGKASEKDGDVTTGVHLCLVGDAAYTVIKSKLYPSELLIYMVIVRSWIQYWHRFNIT